VLDVSPLGSPYAVSSSARINASWLTARFLSPGAARSLRPFARPQRPSPLSSGHSGVNVPSLKLRSCPPIRSIRPFGSLAPQPLIAPGALPLVSSTAAASLPRARCWCFPHGSTDCYLRSPLPFGSFWLPLDQSVQPLSPPAGSPDWIARSPLAPRNRFYF